MSELSRQVGQLLWVGFDGHTVPAGLAERIRTSLVGGATIFRRNVVSPEQVAALNQALHAGAPADAALLVSIDQEGGRVQRLRTPATEFPPMFRLGELYAREPVRAVALAEKIGAALGAECAAVGVDLDFAPVLDVLTNPANPVIGDRALATETAAVIALGGGLVRGLASQAVLASGKHFPGHGDTHLDSHLALPRVDHDLGRLTAVEMAPFAALAPELPTIMTAHVIFAALDAELPATLSPKVLRDHLRAKLGYDGVVISDDLEMKAIADHFGVGDAVVRGLLAGCDAFLLCHREDLQLEAHETLTRSAERDGVVRDRVREAHARVAKLKAQHTAARARQAPPSLTAIGAPAHRALAAELGNVVRAADPTDRGAV